MPVPRGLLDGRGAKGIATRTPVAFVRADSKGLAGAFGVGTESKELSDENR
jgi:hypothetical protein